MNENIEATTTAQVNNSDHVERFLKKFLKIARIIKAHDPNVCAYVNIYQNGILIDGVQVYVYDSADNLIVNVHNPDKYSSQEALINVVQRYEVIGETEANIFVNCGSNIKKCGRLIYALTKLLGIKLKPEELSYTIISTYGHIDTDPNGACNRYNNVYEDIRLDADSNYRDPNICDVSLIVHLENHRLLDVDTSINNVQGSDSGFNFQNIGRLLSIACGIFCILMATGVIDLFGSDDDDYDTPEMHTETYTPATVAYGFHSNSDVLEACEGEVRTDLGWVYINSRGVVTSGGEHVGNIVIDSFNTDKAYVTMEIYVMGTSIDYKYTVEPGGAFYKR